MLSISQPLRSAHAADYYTSLAREDYYTKGGESPGKWWGKGARRLGLLDKVDRKALRDLLDGRHPATRQALVQNPGLPTRQAAWDATFSASKSVSTFASQLDPSERAQAALCQDRAARASLGFLEVEAGQTRRGHGGIRREPAGLVAALFQHDTSRAQDPQLHTHALIINVGVRDDGSTGALVSREIFQLKMLAGAIYRRELAFQLHLSLGLSLHWKGDQFEIVGVPRKLTEEFSKRRKDIEAALSGTKGAVAAKIAALKTRARKSLVPRSELLTKWQEIGRQLGWGPAAARSLIKRGRPNDVKPVTREFVRKVASQLSAGGGSFTYHSFLRAILRHEECPIASFADIQTRVAGELCQFHAIGATHGVTRYAFESRAEVAQNPLGSPLEQGSEMQPVGASNRDLAPSSPGNLDQGKVGAQNQTSRHGTYAFPEKNGRGSAAKPLMPRAELTPDLVREAASSLTVHQSHFSLNDLVRTILDDPRCPLIPLEDIESKVAAHLGQFPQLGLHHGARQYTTFEMLALERELLRGTVARNGETRHRLRPKAVERALSKARLSDEQKAAIRSICETPGGIKVIDGLAGTGKSKLLDTARQLWEGAGRNVVGVALSGRAAASLESGSKIPSVTISRLIRDLDKRAASFAGISLSKGRQSLAPRAPRWNPLRRVTIPYIKVQIAGRPLRPRSVLVVDEAGMVGTRQLGVLLSSAAKARAKVILVGDTRQLPAIEAGAPFRALADLLCSAKLKEIQRQKENWGKQVVRDLAVGDPRRAIHELDKRDRIHVFDDHHEAKAKLIEKWSSAQKKKRKELILTATTKDARELNQLAQKRRLKSKSLGRLGVSHAGQKFHSGDRVLFTANSKALGVTNGSLGTVKSVGWQRLTVVLDEKGPKGRKVRVQLSEYPHIRLGYAVTTHKAQGTTADNAYVLFSGSRPSREMTYVQLSRARDEAHLFADRTDAGHGLAHLQNLVSRHNPKLMAHDLTPGGVREAAGQRSQGQAAAANSPSQSSGQSRTN